jgi:glutamate racemase
MSPSSPIAIIDSGAGGLAVVRALRESLPHERLLYFGDTARTPYGWKSAGTVTAFVRQIVDYLRGYDPKHVVIACNTATSLALAAMRTEFADLSITGIVEPAARAAIEAAGAKEHPLIGIIATEGTIQSKAYERAIHRRRHHARLLLRATPLLVPMVEELRDDRDPLVKAAVQQYLHAMVQRGPDVLILGCTHYSILRRLIGKVAGVKARLIDSAQACAEDVARRLQAAHLLSGAGSGGSLRCFVTDDSPRFSQLASRFLGQQMVAKPVVVSPDDLHALGRTRDLRMSA